ncbi:MAG: hypothetical protein L3J69_05950 [Desulfobacula sp.]|nr:hypothetical protein [Desulfobacula sp.]
MRYETKTNFAKRAGVSRQAIYNHLGKGTLVAGPTGKLDVNNVNNAFYLSSRKGKANMKLWQHILSGEQTNAFIIRKEIKRLKEQNEMISNLLNLYKKNIESEQIRLLADKKQALKVLKNYEDKIFEAKHRQAAVLSILNKLSDTFMDAVK